MSSLRARLLLQVPSPSAATKDRLMQNGLHEYTVSFFSPFSPFPPLSPSSISALTHRFCLHLKDGAITYIVHQATTLLRDTQVPPPSLSFSFSLLLSAMEPMITAPPVLRGALLHRRDSSSNSSGALDTCGYLSGDYGMI